MEVKQAMARAKSRPDELHALVLAWHVELQNEWIKWAEEEIARLKAELKEKARI